MSSEGEDAYLQYHYARNLLTTTDVKKKGKEGERNSIRDGRFASRFAQTPRRLERAGSRMAEPHLRTNHEPLDDASDMDRIYRGPEGINKRPPMSSVSL